MVPEDIPADILAFLAQRIDSVPQLEALLMMSERADSVWTVDDVAARTYTNRATARAVLEALQRRGLVEADEREHTFRFKPRERTDEALVARVARYYRANLVIVATLIHDKASASIQEFARAFEFKKDH
jgi:ribosomal protein S12 methylthiotransferase accessory factor YcaO